MTRRTHDHKVLIGSTPYSFDLVRDDDGKAMYSVTEDIPEYSPQLAFEQTNWINGHGNYWFDDEEAFFEGESIDTTQEGRIILGPEINEVGQPYAYNLRTVGSGTIAVYGINWEAQTFTPSASHTITKLRLKLYREGSPGTVTVSIKATSGGEPSGADLCSGTIDGDALTTDTDGEWKTLDLGGGAASTGDTLYAFAIRAPSGDASNLVRVHCHLTGATYEGGQQFTSSTSGSSWASITTADILFAEYGDTAQALDSAPVCFGWFAGASSPVQLCATAGKIYRNPLNCLAWVPTYGYSTDTEIDTDEELDASETGVDCDADASSAIPVGTVILIEDELMYVSATGTTLTVIRGYQDTTAATHTTNQDIYKGTDVANVTDLKEFKGVMYAAVGSSTKWYYSSDGNVWTQTDLTNAEAVKFLAAYNAAGTAVSLWSVKTPNELYRTTDGRTAAAGGVALDSAAYIGDTSADITNIFLVNDNLMIGREDNLYNYDSGGGTHPLMDELKFAQSTNNFKYVANWQTATYFSRGDSLGELSSSNTFEPVGPLERTIDIGKVGTCVGLTSDPKYLYIAMDEGTNTHIYKAREVKTARGLKWQYCPWVYLGTNACATIAVCQHSATDRRLWFGYGTHTGYVTITDNPTTDSSATFCASGWLRMSYDYAHNLYWDKLYNRLITDTKGCASGKTVTVKYRKDTDTSATNFAAAITTNGVVETDATSLVACKKIQFETHLATDASTSTPEVLMFRAMGIEKPEAIRVHECVYAIGDRPTDRAETLRSALRTARTSVALIRFADLRYGDKVSGTAGTDFTYAICQPGYPKEVEVKHEKGRAPELGLQVRWQEVSNTITDDWGYDYSKMEDIFQDVYDSANSRLRISVI